MTEEKKITGYPSIDKPWLRYYSEEAINAKLPECTIYEYLWENNKDHLNDIALFYFDRKITYKKLFENIEKTASALKALGIGKGDIVTIQALSLPQVIYIIYALSKIGGIANLIYATSTPKEVNENLEQTKSKLYITIDFIYSKLNASISSSYLKNTILLSVAEEMPTMLKVGYNIKNKAAKYEGEIITWKDFLRTANNTDTPVSGKSSDTVVMVYTGGTTGKSKGVMLSNYNLNVAALQYLHLGFERQKLFLAVLPSFVAFGITVTMHMPLTFGMKTVLGISTDPSNIAPFVEKYKINYIICGVTQAEKMINSLAKKKLDLSSLICLSVGGDVLSPKLEERLNKFLLEHNAKNEVAQGYAMSETSASTAASTYTPYNVVYKSGTIGVPLVYTNIKVIDTETYEELSYNEQGEICIAGPCVMMGYFDNEEETKNVLKTHNDGIVWVHTGDIGSIDEDGFIKITGRIKRMILTWENGVCHKVFSKVIEDSLLKTGVIKSISIVGREKAQWDNELIAFLTLENGAAEEEALAVIEQYALNNFETYERPAKYIVKDRLPLTTIGKVDYRALEKEALEV